MQKAWTRKWKNQYSIRESCNQTIQESNDSIKSGGQLQSRPKTGNTIQTANFNQLNNMLIAENFKSSAKNEHFNKMNKTQHTLTK